MPHGRHSVTSSTLIDYIDYKYRYRLLFKIIWVYLVKLSDDIQSVYIKRKIIQYFQNTNKYVLLTLT